MGLLSPSPGGEGGGENSPKNSRLEPLNRSCRQFFSLVPFQRTRLATTDDRLRRRRMPCHPLPKGPRCAKRTTLLGKLTRGGLGFACRVSDNSFPGKLTGKRWERHPLGGVRIPRNKMSRFEPMNHPQADSSPSPGGEGWGEGERSLKSYFASLVCGRFMGRGKTTSANPNLPRKHCHAAPVHGEPRPPTLDAHWGHERSKSYPSPSPPLGERAGERWPFHHFPKVHGKGEVAGQIFYAVMS
jgi:hypothetical protein